MAYYMININELTSEQVIALRQQSALEPRPVEAVEAINELFAALGPLGKTLELSQGERLCMTVKNEKVMYLLLSGFFTFRHHTSGTIIGQTSGPSIAGLSDMFISAGNIDYFKVESSSVVIRLTQLQFFDCLNEKNHLWLHVAAVQAWITKQLCLRDLNLNTRSSYQVIRYLLSELSLQPDAIKNSIAAYRYIQDRSMISRSLVMSILSELQRGGYVEIKRGVLKKIYKLPDRF